MIRQRARRKPKIVSNCRNYSYPYLYLIFILLLILHIFYSFIISNLISKFPSRVLFYFNCETNFVLINLPSEGPANAIPSASETLDAKMHFILRYILLSDTYTSVCVYYT